MKVKESLTIFVLIRTKINNPVINLANNENTGEDITPDIDYVNNEDVIIGMSGHSSSTNLLSPKAVSWRTMYMIIWL